LILRKAIYYVTAVVSLAATAVICVVFLALALHAAVKPAVGEAWAGVVVAGAAVLLAAAISAVMVLRAAPPKSLRHEPKDLSSRMFELAQAKPLVALGIIGAIAAVALKSPRTTATFASALLAGRASKK
jgi:hypothetical protein